MRTLGLGLGVTPGQPWSQPFWSNVVGATVSGRSMVKTASAVWGNCAASSIQSIVGNGFCQFSTNENTLQKMAGLTHTRTDNSFDTIDFGIYLAANTIDIFEDGTEVGVSVGTVAPGDILQVVVAGSVVTYKKNGALLYTSGKAPSHPLYFMAAMFNTAAQLQGCLISATP